MVEWKELVLVLFVIVNSCSADDDPNCPTIIPRSQWASKPPKLVSYMVLPVKYALIQHTASRRCTEPTECAQEVEKIRASHMENGFQWANIGYSFLIGGDGNVYEGRGWHKEGAHTYGWNKKAIGIAFIGSFDVEGASEKMLDAAHKLIVCGKSKNILKSDVRVLAARQVRNTLSPGSALYNQIQTWSEWASKP